MTLSRTLRGLAGMARIHRAETGGPAGPQHRLGPARSGPKDLRAWLQRQDQKEEEA